MSEPSSAADRHVLLTTDPEDGSSLPDPHRLTPGEPVDLGAIPTRGGDAFHDGPREEAEAELDSLRDELDALQERFFAEGQRKLLLVLQALDAGGKNSTTRHVFRGVNPEGVRVVPFKVPTAPERARDFLWRVHREVPDAGRIGVFNRSHYEDVLVVRVDELAPESVWRRRYEQINRFERLLHDTGTAIVKVYLHISPEEQKERFEDRLERPDKHWKFSPDDLRKRSQWDEYRIAYEEALERCGTPWAPWWVVPADQKWYRNLAVARILVSTLRALDPQYPPDDPAWEALTIE